MEAIQIVEYRHVEGGRDRSFLLVAAHVKVGVIGAAIGQPVNQPRVGVEGEDDRFVGREQGVEFRIAQAVRMLGLRLQLHEVDDIDDPDLEVGQVLPQDGNGGERLEGGDVARATHDDVRLDIVLVTGPLPDADTLGAVFYGGLHRQATAEPDVCRQ